MAERFGNSAATTLAAAITTTGQTSISVTSGAAPFPSVAQFRVRIDSELLIVTAGAGTGTWTVTRGAEGTTATTHSNGAAVTHILTAGGLKAAFGWFDVTSVEYGAKGDNSTDDTTAIQAALTAAGVAGGIVCLPPGTYLVSAALTVPAGVRVVGAGTVATTVKIKASSTAFQGVFQAVNVDGVEVSDLMVDLNKANTSDPADDTKGQAVYFVASNATGITNAAVRRVKVKNGWQIGMRALSTSAANPLEVDFEDCQVTGCAKRGIFSDRPTDLRVVRCRLSGNNTSEGGSGQIQVTNGATDSSILIDGNRCVDGGGHGIAVSFCEGPVIVNNRCHRHTTAGCWGIVVSEDVTNPIVKGNRCKGNTGGMSIDVATLASGTVKDTRGIIQGNITSDSTSSHGFNVQALRDTLFTGNIAHTNASGVGFAFVGCEKCTVSGNIARGNSVGMRTNDGAGGIAAGGRNFFEGNQLRDNTTSYQDQATTKSRWESNDSDESTSVASATTVTLPQNGAFFTISGTTTVTSVTAAYAGRVVTLQFSGILTFTDGSNLKLAGNFVTTADDTITLVSDGTNWFEVARSVN